MRRIAYFYVALMASASSPAFTEPLAKTTALEPLKAQPGNRPALRLSLRQALLISLGKNLDIRVAQVSPEVLVDGIQQAIAGFDTIVSAASGHNSQKRQAASQLDGAAVSERDSTDVTLGISKKIRTGGTLSADYRNNILETNSRFVGFNSIYSGDVALALTQPLLKGAGLKVNEGPILIARNNYRISLLDFDLSATNVAADTEQAYWDLVFAIDNLKVQKFALKQAQQLLTDTRERVKVGIQTKNDVIQAQAEVADREETVILAEQAILDAEDLLKALTNLFTRDSQWDTGLLPSTRPPLEVPPVDVMSSMDQASRNRPEYLSSKLDLENRDIRIVLAKNARYPQVDLSASFGLNGVTGNYGNTVDSLLSRDFYSWGLGLTLEVPLGIRSGRSTLKKRQAEKAQALLELKKLEQDIFVEIRSAVRQVITAQKRIKTTEASKRLQQAKLEAEQELLKAGRSTTHDVLEFQLDLARAQSRYLRAVLDQQKARVTLEKARGTFLQDRQFRVLGNSVRPGNK